MKSSERTVASSARTAEATDGATRITGARVTTAAMTPLTSAMSTKASTHGALADAKLMTNAKAREYAAKSTTTVLEEIGAMSSEQRKTHLTQA